MLSEIVIFGNNFWHCFFKFFLISLILDTIFTRGFNFGGDVIYLTIYIGILCST